MNFAFFRHVRMKFQLSYLVIITALLLLNWSFRDFHNFGFNTIIYTIIIVLFGFKFNFLDAKFLPLLTRKFKHNWLNIVNYPLQIVVFFNLFPIPTENYFNVFKNMGNFFHFTTATGHLSSWGLIGSFTVSLLILLPFLFTVVIPEVKNMGQLLVITIEITVVYVIYLMHSVSSTMSLFGDLTDSGELLSLLSTLFIVAPFVYISLSNQALPLPQLLSRKKTVTIKTAVVLLILFTSAFCIDSAIWQHPFPTWQAPSTEELVFALRSGIGEELIFRGLILSIGINSLKNFKYNIISSIIISSVVFGFIHLVNILAGVEVTSVVSSTIDAVGLGFMFAVLYILTRKLIFVIGIHCLWDLLQEIITGEGNMSVAGLSGLAISFIVAALFVVSSFWIMRKHENIFFNNI